MTQGNLTIHSNVEINPKNQNIIKVFGKEMELDTILPRLNRTVIEVDYKTPIFLEVKSQPLQFILQHYIILQILFELVFYD